MVTLAIIPILPIRSDPKALYSCATYGNSVQSIHLLYLTCGRKRKRTVLDRPVARQSSRLSALGNVSAVGCG
jgi:hypothetical protein